MIAVALLAVVPYHELIPQLDPLDGVSQMPTFGDEGNEELLLR